MTCAPYVPESYDEARDAPYMECPRFEACSVNRCPLDPLQDERESFGDDPEPRCRLPKRRRMGIAARHPVLLPRRGLRPVELANLRVWEALSPEERERRKSVMAAARPPLERRLQALAAARAARKAGRTAPI